MIQVTIMCKNEYAVLVGGHVAVVTSWGEGRMTYCSAILNLLNIRCCVYVGGRCCWRCVFVANSLSAAHYVHLSEQLVIRHVSNESRVVSWPVYEPYATFYW